MPPRVIALEPAALERLAGTYRTPEGETLQVEVRQRRLLVTGADGRLLAVLGSLVPAGSAPFAKVEARTKQILESASKGDYRGVFEAFGGQMPLKRIEEQEGNIWRQMRENNGSFEGVTILGSSRQGPGVRVVARLKFQRGSLSIVYTWEEENLAGIQAMDQPPGSTFFPLSATEFVRFTLRDPKPFVIRFESGATREVVLVAPTGEIRAAKLP
jgi:hypothetical protein